MTESETNDEKTWAIVLAVVATSAIIVAGMMFFLGMSVGQNSAKQHCDCTQSKSS